MKRYSLCLALVYLGASIINLDTIAHGFDATTHVTSADQYYYLMDNLYMSTDPEYYADKDPEDQDYVLSYDVKNDKIVKRRVVSAGSSTTDCFFKIGFGPSPIADFRCTPLQEFYLPEKKTWVPAFRLRVGDKLLSSNGQLKPITRLKYVRRPLEVYLIHVEGEHNFFVGNHQVLAHNIALPFEVGVKIWVAFAEGGTAGAGLAKWFGPISIAGGFALGGVIGVGLAYTQNGRSRNYEAEWIHNSIEEYLQSINPDILLQEDKEGLAYRDPWDKNKPKKDSGDKKGTQSNNNGSGRDDSNSSSNKNENRNRNNRNNKQDHQKERKKNEMHVSEFAKIISDRYDKIDKFTWRLKAKAQSIQKAEFLYWDHFHGEVEAYNRAKEHLGALDPKTLQFIKSADPGRKL